MNTTILFFNQINEDSFNLVGGKGFNLGKMTKRNLPVPEGFCITTDAFYKFIEPLKDNDLFKQLDNVDVDDLEKIQELTSSLRDLIIEKSLSDSIKQNIKEAIESIGEDDFYAVRSSATAEDLPDMSFAGQQDTYLNVHGFENLIENVKYCWASLYTQRAVVYRKKNNLNEDNVLISVVVQKMVDSQKSGIMFTADPINNNYNHLTIDAGFGLGESLVGGLITPDLYKVNKNENKIIAKEINAKKLAIYRKNDGGTEQILLDKNKQKEQVLSEREIYNVAQLGHEIEEYYQTPQDIEWAIDESGKIYILQSRMITSLYPRVENSNRNGKSQVYISASHIQVMTKPIKPLGLDIFKRVMPFDRVEEGSNFKIMSQAGGRLYANCTEILRLPIRDKIIKDLMPNVDYLVASALGEYIEKYPLKKKLPSKTTLKMAKNLIIPILKISKQNYAFDKKPDALASLVELKEELIDDVYRNINKGNDLCEKIVIVEELLSAFIFKLAKQLIPNVAPGILSDRKLRNMLEELDLLYLEDSFVSGLEGNITTEMGLRVGDLADLIRDNLKEIDILNKNPKDAHLLLLKNASDELKSELSDFLRQFGMRGIGEIDITNPRYQEDFTPISMSILNNINTLEKNEHRENYQRLIEKSSESERLILEAYEKIGKDDLVKKVKNHLNNIKTFLPLREYGKYIIVGVFNEVRKVIDEVGDKLEKDNLLDNRYDIFYLNLDEIYQALTEKVNFKESIQCRKIEYDKYEKLNPPRVITNEGEIFSGSYSKEGVPEGAFVGMPVSAGIYEGYARVILNPNNDSLQKNEILVTKFTDPGWTPLFVNAKGLVLEVGGLMTHGAIVSREYGIPALVGVEDATSLIKTGDYLRIDAYKGYVEIICK
ncbi:MULTISPECIES: phosphoenolpyruvate synthase [Clostridioides]|uniref:phosphoenolpyruvate synthase n=1 Tax=Clostridioides sp. ZZV14-6387 TaxID=2811497 RepID=UPI0007BB7777|nr:phosphoenolpyruvate synthase [Clostridioides sp. ZZV14-6387]CZR95808.1 Phosphoenolpyruvate synthase [Clostridioides difficile]CZS06405.1 Phosphoenolpyruvate synthase [Clostridioides difficile]